MRAPCTFRMSVSPKPLPHRTSTFQRIRRSNPAETCSFSRPLLEERCDSIVLSAPLSIRPDVWTPSPLPPGFPGALGGRNFTGYYGSAAPPVALATYPPTLYREPQEVPALLTQHFLRQP
jgi:hypothetical protein